MKRVLLCVLSLCLLICFTGCNMSSLDKEPITANRFVDYFDGIASFEVYDRGVNNDTYSCVIEADNKDNKYDIFYYEYQNVGDAKYEFGELVAEVNKFYGDNTVKNSKDIGNTNRYAIGDSETYSVVSRIGNTIIFTSTVPKSCQDEVKSYLDELGY